MPNNYYKEIRAEPGRGSAPVPLLLDECAKNG
jgi:hypothetical protein